MENRSHAFAAGLFVIFLGVAAIAGALWLGAPKGPKLAPIDLLTAHSVVGLKVDAPVRFRGVDVGHVESIAFDPQQLGQIRVRIGVDPASPISTSTYAKVSYQGITGVAFIQLDDAAGKDHAPLQLSDGKIVQMDLQASFLETAEEDVRGLVLKAGRVASHLDELLGEPNQKRFASLLDSTEKTANRYGTLAQNLQPAAKALPGLLQDTQGAVHRVASLAEDVDRKLAVLDTVATAAQQLGGATDDLRRDTLPRVNTLLDEVSVDAHELKHTLHQANARPQSFIFGPEPLPAGPGERGFIETTGASK